LNRAREQARSVQCMSNLRQLGVAWQMYLKDYPRGTIPSDMSYKVGSGVRWYQYLDGTEVMASVYLPTGSVYRCPKMNAGTYGIFHPQAYDPVRVDATTPEFSFFGLRLTKDTMDRPTDFAILFDTTSSTTPNKLGDGALGWWTDRYANDPGVWMAHKNSANALFADFHVEGCNPGKLMTLSNYNYTESQRTPKRTRSGVSYYRTQDFKPVYQQLP
jgi:prepilin-type processing-associated H-X9-DG protein